MAEGVGVEPTKHFISVSLVLKTRHPTGDVALPLSEKTPNSLKLLFKKNAL
jgi:hypothetical protein